MEVLQGVLAKGGDAAPARGVVVVAASPGCAAWRALRGAVQAGWHAGHGMRAQLRKLWSDPLHSTWALSNAAVL